jgi:serine/threonine-protein kinase RsbW
MSAGLGTARPLAEADFFSPELGPSPRGAIQAESGMAREDRDQTVAAACRAFAAQPLQVAQARRFVGGVLSGFTVAADIVLCVSELASNAVLHSNSRAPGGQFVVRAWISAVGRVHAEVEDRGGPWIPDTDPDEERGRGLLIVAALSTRWGITGSEAGRVAWLDFDPA